MAVFVSHDKEDSNGVRAEIHVSTLPKVKVKDLDERDKAVRGSFKPEWLKYEVGGWLGKDEPAYARLKEAYENGEEVDIRIESQRKSAIDRSIPINELRSGNDIAKRVTSKIVAVDGIFTSEARTHPSEDPVQGSQPAEPVDHSVKPRAAAAVGNAQDVLELIKKLSTNQDITEEVLSALQAQALIAGATAEEVRAAATVDNSDENANVTSNYPAKEAPAFRERNSDGRINLGNYAVTSAVGSEQFAAQNLRSRGLNNNQDTVEFFAQLILAITDRIQTGAYGSQQPDRAASSHTRIRGIVYDTIEDNPFPIDLATLKPGSRDEVEKWVQTVGKLARRRFLFAANAAYQRPSVTNLLDTLGGGVSSTPPVPEASAPEVNHVDEPSYEPEYEPAPEYDAAETVAEAPVSVPEAPAQPAPVSVASPASPASPSDSGLPDAEGLEVFPPEMLPPGAINAQNKPSDETVEQFKQYMTEEVGLSNDELTKVTALLRLTFGKSYSKITNIPEDNLLDFLDFYIAAGPDNFRNVLASL